ncbi:ARL-6-interacting protein, putative [Pediculus humanus corporis]|uniref:ARL-6-interacting protein, putative n=1 Tax=Pediculus humanus subsp. corporis TaxID=121224 RepID=E0V9X6_PEDHC|nr:ARL-6-interacting protein, putative [Pediculus humanus corporis]EEB10182.1 ARL-6-interacting protein, putative [Pediculus humanus corporis]
MAEHLSVTELEKEAKKLKRELEAWRDIILPIDSILSWEKNSYIGIIVATTSVGFFLLWLMNLSILSIIARFGILITIVDYFVPTIAESARRPERWTSAKERKLESICRSLASYKLFLIKLIKSFYKLKMEHPKFVILHNCYFKSDASLLDWK